MKKLRIYDYVEEPQAHDVHSPPKTLNFVTGLYSLVPHRVVTKQVRGEVREVTYYASAAEGKSGIVYSAPLVREDVSYVRSPEGFALTQTKLITWILEDESDHADTKAKIKHYDSRQQHEEVVRRRSNVVGEVKGRVLEVCSMTEVEELMEWFSSELGSFVESGDMGVCEALSADTTMPWLDRSTSTGKTLRADLLFLMNIWENPEWGI